ncbi:MAG: DUF4352 domain-containing protein [Thermoanaerobaculia bacterium]
MDRSLEGNSKRPLVLIAGALLLAFVIVAGCGEKAAESEAGATASNVTAEASEAATPPAEASPLQPGEFGKSDPFEIRVTKVEKASGWTKEPPAGHEYVVVTVEVKNVSGETKSIGAGSFGMVRDDSGNRASWEPSTGIETDPPTFGNSDIAPDGRFAGSLIFAIPTAMSETELHYTVGYAPKPALRFAIKK